MSIENIIDLFDQNAPENVAEMLDEEDLTEIGQIVLRDYRYDRLSRDHWEKMYDNVLKMATQAQEIKNTPWEGAANVKYPLLSIAGLQFHARAYPALVPSKDIVKGVAVGADPDFKKADRARRVGQYMSYQITEEMEDWEDHHDRLLLTLAYTGCEFKKTWYDHHTGQPKSVHVPAKNLVKNYYAKNIETAKCKTEMVLMAPNLLVENMRGGYYLEYDIPESTYSPDSLQQTVDDMQGQEPPPKTEDADFLILEQHRLLDLDEDGYKEPYIVTVMEQTGEVLSIVPRFNLQDIAYNAKGQVQKIVSDEYYTQYDFIPDPAGSGYGIGFGLLVGPINETANSLINQLLDAGTLSNLQSGFISKSLRIKGGNIRLSPGEWKQVNAMSQELGKSIMPLPVREPSNVLFQLLQLMLDSGQRLSSTVDMMVGENPGQNQKATTSMIVREEGLKVFTGIYKRVRRSMKKEFGKLYKINSDNMPDYPQPFQPLDQQGVDVQAISKQDFAMGVGVYPGADPNVATDVQRQTRAQLLLQLAQTGGFNEYEVKKRALEAADVNAIDQVLPDPKGPNAIPMQPNPDLLKIQEQTKNDERKYDLQLAIHMDTMELEWAKLGKDHAALHAENLQKNADRELQKQQLAQNEAKSNDTGTTS